MSMFPRYSSEPFVGSLQPHQARAVQWLLNRPRAVLADDVGLGKTVTAAALIGALERSQALPRLTSHGTMSRYRVLWLTERALVAQTKAELKKFLPSLTVEDDGAKAPDEADILVCSHAVAKSRQQWLTSKAVNPALVVVDEASKGKGGGSYAVAMRALTARAQRVLTMTATPLENDPMELYELFNLTGTPRLWPRDEYAARFVTFQEKTISTRWGTRTDQRPVGWQEAALTEVRAYVQCHVLRRTAEGVGLPLPTKVKDDLRLVPLPEPQLKLCNDLLGRDERSKAEGVALVHNGRSPVVSRMVEEVTRRGGEQAVVYCERLEALGVAEKALRDAGVTVERIEGENSEKKRAQAVERFQAGEVQVLLGSSVLERGLNLQHCRVLISLSVSWNPAREAQREGRIRRIGSPHETYEHVVFVPDTGLHRSQLRILDNKAALGHQVGL